MQFELTLEQRQTLSQRMIQSASILQMSATELENYLNEQSLENPVIDLIHKEPVQQATPDKGAESYQWIASHDEQNRYLYYRMESREDELPEWNMEYEHGENMSDYLWEQIMARNLPEEYEHDIKIILNSLDENGYFTEPVDEFLTCFSMSKDRFTLLLSLVQSLEPAGVGARSLPECLCLQLERQNLLTPGITEFIEHHLEQMARNQLPAIARDLGISLDEVREYCRIIRALNPRPAANLGRVYHTHYIDPDVVVVKFKGHLDILLNETLYPGIHLNTHYIQLYEQSTDKEVQDYLQNKIAQAEWIRQCIAQRNNTLFSVVREIVTFQADFFQSGPAAMRPLRLIDIAGRLGVHESTVSRAIHQKYLQSTWGTYPLSAFFPKNANRSAGRLESGAITDASVMTVADIKAALKEIIASENKTRPYSDRILAEMLSSRGYTISRRTVAKYREEENIPGTSGRKEY